jgi:hypothetical protein
MRTIRQTVLLFGRIFAFNLAMECICGPKYFAESLIKISNEFEAKNVEHKYEKKW